MNWLKQWLCGDDLDTLRRYRSAVETHKASSSHDSAVTAWAIYHEAEADDPYLAASYSDEGSIERRSHPFK